MLTKSPNNFFSSKSDVLKILSRKLKNSKIEHLYDFTVQDWNNNKNAILTKIQKQFLCKLIVRSSARGEDSVTSSQAGNYETVLNVDSSKKYQIKKAIEQVINSYIQKDNFDSQNQILIQSQTTNVFVSGVIFTKSEQNGSPYYVINYDESTSTETVTKGQTTQMVKIFRKTKFLKISNKWKKLLKSIQEIEKITNNTSLDIEFAITNNKAIVIFQVRPITTINASDNISDVQVGKIIKANQNKFKKLLKSHSKFGKKTIFSDMADWNPSEIIGTNPNLLDYSLYDYLILKRSWSKGREKIGYAKTGTLGLMQKFGNKPYIDLRASFNSLTLSTIKFQYKKKLIDFYFQKIEKCPYLHDKIEFDILFSSYDFSTSHRLKELLNYGFTKSQINEIKFQLINFTNQIISDFPQIERNYFSSIDKLKNNRLQIEHVLSESKPKSADYIVATKKLLKDCIQFGTIPFSTMARIAFIGTALLKTLLKENLIDIDFYEALMRSLQTPVSTMQDDLLLLQNKKLTSSKFLAKYGHLRSGTYDIQAPRYDTKNPFSNLEEIKNTRKPKFVLKNSHKLSKLIKQHGFTCSLEDLFVFIQNSLIYREILKFEFTKNLSLSLELIAHWGEKMGFSREDLSHLSIQTIFKFENVKKSKSFWKQKISEQRIKMIKNNLLQLPPLLLSDDNFEILEYYISKPNFITSKKITKETCILEKSSTDISNKIVLIENADPGYDWIFSKKPAGLITKYGGVASHMAIRCSELGIPAAIGCGDTLYPKLLQSSKLLLDCINYFTRTQSV